MALHTPTSDLDFYSDDVVADPYLHYRHLRNAGAAVWLSRHSSWALTRYKEVQTALRMPTVFSSAHGCGLNDIANAASSGSLLCSDDPAHLAMRKIFAQPLAPSELQHQRESISRLAEDHIERLVALGTFDAVSDLAQFLPLTVVADMVGLSPTGRENMLEWAKALFNSLGPADNSRMSASFPVVGQVIEYLRTVAASGDLRPGGWAARLFECVDKGLLGPEQATSMLLDYTVPALDTTINATSSAIWLFAQHPEQWDIVRADPSLIPNAVEETVRLESPIRAFSRYVVQDHELDDVKLSAGSRVLVVYASANRDERRWEEPDRFDVKRKVQGHVGFGFGIHTCAGMHLARMEITCLLEALARRVSRFEIQEFCRTPHNILRGLDSLRVSIVI